MLIEKINGLTTSILFTSEILNINSFKAILDSIRRIQSSKCIKENIDLNIYDNYSKKLEKRYNSYDYSNFSNHNKIFNEINDYLKNYESLDKGIITVIHGDPVLTNIMINNFDKIKFIDMRKLGSKLGSKLNSW